MAVDQTYTPRLIIVSNRLPSHLVKNNGTIEITESDGGLVSALRSYFERFDEVVYSSVVWIGTAEFSEKQWHQFRKQQPSSGILTIDPVFIDRKIYNGFYNGFCNTTLWPLFHYFPSFVEFDNDTFQYYETVNKIFADKIAAILRPGDILWIHDYQLMLVPGMIRNHFPQATIGFFLHIPFPSFELFRLLHKPWKEKIIAGLLGADLIGFHVHEYVQHFLKTVQMVKGFDHRFRSILVENREVKAEMFPLGIDYIKFNGANQRHEVAELIKTFTPGMPERK